MKDFKDIQAACFDTCFGYRFFYHLRNYVQHCGMPLGAMNASVYRDDTGDIVAQFSIHFDRDLLLKNYDWHKMVRADLQKHPNRDIEIIPYLDDFHTQIELVNYLCARIEIGLVAESWSFLAERIEEVHSKYPGAFPSIISYKPYPSGRSQMSEIKFPVYTMKQIEDIWRTVSPP